MKILLTGSGGFIGKNLSNALKDEFTLLSPRSKELDLTNKADVERYCELNNPDLIIHCATTGGLRGVEDPISTFKDNVSMVENLVNSKRSDVRIILFGSGAMYGKTRRLHKVKEIDIGNYTPEDLYGLSKLKISDIVKERNDILMLNIFGCYGYEELEIRFPTYAITQNIKRQPIIINNDVIFDYLFVEDMIKIVKYFIKNLSYDKIINITPTESTSLVEISREINKISDYKSEIIVNGVNLNGEYTGDNTLLLRNYTDLKFTPINIGLKKLYEYIKAQIK